jgi:hypothetical protein
VATANRELATATKWLQPWPQENLGGYCQTLLLLFNSLRISFLLISSFALYRHSHSHSYN